MIAGENFLLKKKALPRAPSKENRFLEIGVGGAFAAFRWSESHKGVGWWVVVGLGIFGFWEVWFVIVNGISVASPSWMRVTVLDIGSEDQRSAGGSLVVDRVAVKRKVELKWAVLSAAQMGALLGAVGNIFFEAEAADPSSGSMVMGCWRCSEKVMGVLRMVGGEPVWTDVEMEWLEK